MEYRQYRVADELSLCFVRLIGGEGNEEKKVT